MIGNYVIVTPTKNEEEQFKKLVNIMENQTLKPSLWVIVDESDDNTPNVVKEAMARHKWIKGIFLDRSEGYLGLGYAIACKSGFEFAKKYCKRNELDYQYIGLVDADATMNEDHFEKLISKFEKNPKLGIASGIEYWDISGKLARNAQREDLPIGPVRLWSKECFEETGGYIVSEAPPDTISNIKAKLKGWETKQFSDIRVVTRRTSTARGFYRGFFQNGRYAYVVHTPLYIVLLKAIKYSFRSPYYIGLAYILGYVTSMIHKAERIKDDEVRTYMKYERPMEIYRHHIRKLRGGWQ